MPRDTSYCEQFTIFASFSLNEHPVIPGSSTKSLGVHVAKYELGMSNKQQLQKDRFYIGGSQATTTSYTLNPDLGCTKRQAACFVKHVYYSP